MSNLPDATALTQTIRILPQLVLAGRRAGFAKMVERAGEAAALGFNAHPHMLRHGCGFALANKEHDTRALQVYLGHKNIQHTVRDTGAGADALQGFLGGTETDVSGYVPTMYRIMVHIYWAYRRHQIVGGLGENMSNRQREARRPRVLIIEDEALIAHCLEDLVRSYGLVVAEIVLNLPSARKALGACRFDAALVDLRLGCDVTTEIVDVLQERGTPFAFITGYEHALEPRHSAVPLLQKPFTDTQLRAVLEGLVGPLQTNQWIANKDKTGSA